jgi:integrase
MRRVCADNFDPAIVVDVPPWDYFKLQYGSRSSRFSSLPSFFKLVGRDWTPQIVDDPRFQVAILTGGRKLRRWGIREECVTRLLFETGGRIHEIAGLTLGDWRNRGLTKEVTAASKGSHGKRVKFFRFSSESATLSRRGTSTGNPGRTIADVEPC